MHYIHYLCVSDKCFSKFEISDKMAKLSTPDLIHILQCDILSNNDFVYDVQVIAAKRVYIMSFFHVPRKAVEKLKEKGIQAAVLFTSSTYTEEQRFKLTRDLDNPSHVSNGLIFL